MMNHLTKPSFSFAYGDVRRAGQRTAWRNDERRAHCATNAVISATGEVKSTDMESKSQIIAHDAIPAVNWPPMTMRFTFTPQTPLNDIKAGSKSPLPLFSRALSLLAGYPSRTVTPTEIASYQHRNGHRYGLVNPQNSTLIIGSMLLAA